MKAIALSGIIGLDVVPDDIRAQLEEAGGQPVEVQVSSPGGIVADGLEIYNLIRRYPGAKTTRLMGQAASMASYIVLAGDHVIAEDNAIFMVHNVSGVALGDHRALRKMADVMDSFSGLLARAYARKSGKSLEEVRALMDAETYLFGAEILEAGFADEIEPAGDGAEDRDEAVALARAALERCEARLKEAQQDAGALDRAVALLGELNTHQPAGVAGAAAEAAHIDEEDQGMEYKDITLEALSKERPELLAAAKQAGIEEGRTQGVAQERKRLEQLNAFRGINADGDKAVEAAIREGKEYGEVAPLIAAAVAKGKTPAADGDNPPDVATGAQTAAGGVAMSAEVAQEVARMGAKVGVTLEDVKKHGGAVRKE